jgi:hypothetical protein
MKKHIVIEVSTTGDIKIEAVGFNGKGCEAATKAIEDALGTVGTRKKKPEFNRDNATNQRT